jgi:ferredoxin-NADP reductase
MTVAEFSVAVTGIEEPVPGIRSLRLAAVDGGPLPSFVAGSHITVDCGGRRNAYSLTNDGVDPHEYHISVLHVRDGRGGSRFVHERVEFGTTLDVGLPRSAFAPCGRAAKHLLVAGGVGVTPIVSHLRHAARWSRPVQVLYTHREGFGAHVDDVVALAGPAAEIYVDQDAFRARTAAVLAEQPVGTHLYVCGPAPMIDFVVGTATGLGWPASRVHVERFALDLEPGEPFDVTLTRSGRTLHVPSGTTLLEILEDAGIPVPSLCRQGVCGECRIPVSDGVPLHRDLYLDDDTKSAGSALMCCVSRAAGATLEIPL